MRVMLDTNIWSSIGDEGVAREFDILMKSRSAEVVVPPSILVEVFDLPRSEPRDRIIRALATGRRIRLPTEAKSECMEFVAEVRRLRPGWMRAIPLTGKIWSLDNFWTNKIWREALSDSTRHHEYKKRERGDHDLILRHQRAQRQEILRTNASLRPLTALTAIPDLESEGYRLPGWSGDAVEAWRPNCCALFWYQLSVKGGRRLLSREDTTYLDWVTPYVEFSALRADPEDFTRLWLYDIEASAVPRNWLRWAINLIQSDFRITGGNPADEQHSTYLPDGDLFLTADANFVKVLKAVREDAPFSFAEPRLVNGDRSVPVLERLAHALAHGT
jgi:hypothetical protein